MKYNLLGNSQALLEMSMTFGEISVSYNLGECLEEIQLKEIRRNRGEFGEIAGRRAAAKRWEGAPRSRGPLRTRMYRSPGAWVEDGGTTPRLKYWRCWLPPNAPGLFPRISSDFLQIVDLGLVSGHLGVDVGSVWVQFGVDWGSVWRHGLGLIW